MWFGSELPRGWQIMSLRSAFDERTEKGGEAQDEYLSLTAKDGVIPYAEKGDVGNKAPEDMSKCKKVSPGDFVLNSMNFGIGSFGVSRYEGVCSSVYLVLKPKEQFNTRYLERIFELPSFQKYAQSLGNGILAHRAAFGWDKMRAIQVPTPPRGEQDAIVQFLDSELGKIDELLSRQLKLEALISARKFSLISSMVYGLDSSSPLIEFPTLPNGWEWRKLKGVASIQASNVDKKQYEDGIPVKLCNYVDVYHNDVITPDLDFMEATATSNEIAKFTLRAGEVIITKDSESESDIGIAAYVETDLPGVVCGYHLSILKPRLGLDGRFLKFVLDSVQAKSHFAKRANGLTRMALGQSAIGDLQVPMPPFAEQQRIASAVSEHLHSIERALSASRKLVSSLREKRTALIAAGVTGKIILKESCFG
jgi:type I restriction enzyme S subunit